MTYNIGTSPPPPSEGWVEALNNQLRETNMIVSLKAMHRFYYEFQATLSANLRYCITADQNLCLHLQKRKENFPYI
jgi:hypothetical protein